MENGILLLDKPGGISSAQALAQLKKKLKLNKLGHAGTLDPMATGLLVVLAGRATRLAAYAEKGEKIYSGTIQFGIDTDSNDISGRIIARSDRIPSFEQVAREVSCFIGEFRQVPPLVSACKVGGERAYALARREGKSDVQLKPRLVRVSNFEIRPGTDSKCYIFRVQCSKGTYVRALARDLGRRLECPACLASLRREASWPYKVEQAKSLELISLEDMLDWQTLFPNAVRLEVEARDLHRLRCGDQGVLRQLSERMSLLKNAVGCQALYGAAGHGRVSGLLVKEDGKWTYGVNVDDTGV